MTEHRRSMIREALEVLHEVGRLHAEFLLYAAVARKVIPRPSVSDFEEALAEAEKLKWVIGVTAKLDEKKWAITDEGEAARREIK